MRCFLSCIVKDIRLFLRNRAGVIVLILPIILMAVLIPGFDETSGARSFVKPFSFAVNDLDDSVFSRSLINQLRDFDIFEDIISFTDSECDPQVFFDKGYAAVLTIPENFFYSMYDMENETAIVQLNPEMPAESAIIKTLFVSVSGIISAEQHARIAEYDYRISQGEVISKDELFYESANYELKRALSRGSIFSEYDVLEDYSESSLKSAFATVTALLTMLIPLCVLKGLPEELSLGIVARIRSTGRGIATLLLSKYLATLVIFLLPFLAINLLVGTVFSIYAYIAVFLVLSSSFLLFASISLLSSSPSKTQLIGNIILIISLLLGGALYPYALLPGFLQSTAYLFLPFYLVRGMNGDASALPVCIIFIPVFMGTLLLTLYSKNYAGRKL